LHIPPGFLLMPGPVALQFGVLSRNLRQFPEPLDRKSCRFDIPVERRAFRIRPW